MDAGEAGALLGAGGFALIVSDLAMPGGDGFSLLGTLAARKTSRRA
jgi:CheY-like chemotaxis protein